MGFWETFSKTFDRPPPFEVPPGATDTGEQVTTDPSKVTDDLFGVLGTRAFFNLPAGDFLCAAIRDSQPNVTFFLMLIEGQRYFYFRESVRDVFNTGASPEACFVALEKMYNIFRKRDEDSFKMAYAQGKLQVNNKVLGG